MGKFMTGKVRFSYVNIFEPRPALNGDLRYSIVALMPKTDIASKQRLDAEVEKVLQENLSNIFKGVKPANLKVPIYDGDGLRANGEPYGSECKGHWVINMNSKTAPQIVDNSIPEPLPIMDKNEFYSGCYGRASMYIGAYNQNGNKGIYIKLNNLQKLEDGPRLDGRTTAAEDFGTPTQAQAIPQPTQAVQPVAQQPMQPATPGYQIDPITGQPMVPPQNFVAPVTNIYGVN